VRPVPDFDVLSEDPERTAEIVKEQLVLNNIKKVKLIHHVVNGLLKKLEQMMLY
jgi:hypothetical protein